MSADGDARDRRVGADTLALVRELARLDRRSAGPGEAVAAERIAERLEALGLATRLERERVHGTYWWPVGLASAAAAAAGAAGSRRAAAVVGTLATAALVDDLEIGPRALRRLLPQRQTVNVVATAGPRDRSQTLVVHCHHDAAHTGAVFNPALAASAAPLTRRARTTPPAMAGAVAGAALVAVGARAGALVSAGYAAAMVDIARSPVVAGANDNLSGLAALLTLARALAERPPERVRVLLLSTGSEEAFLEGMVRFAARHFHELPRHRTAFVCLESIGSPDLFLLDGEGLVRLRRYPPQPRAAIAAEARRLGIPLRTPFRYRFATDGQIPLRAGYPTAVLTSMDWRMAPSNYHWPSDRPENLDLASVAAAARLTEAFVRRCDRQERGAARFTAAASASPAARSTT